MTAIDWALVLALGLSILLGVVRGVVRELFALAGWITGVVLALRFSEPLAASLPFELPLVARTALVSLFIIVAQKPQVVQPADALGTSFRKLCA